MAYVRTNVYVDSSEVPTSAELGYHRVGREYFDVMGMRVREGRAFSPTPSAAHEIVVSQEMANELAPEGSALGICLRLSSATAPCRTVVGVVDDIRDMRLDRGTSPGYYILSSADEEWLSGLIVRARDAGRVHLVQQAAARLTTNSFSVESYAVSTLVAEGRRTWQAGAVVLSLFAGVAILLSVVGLSASIAEDASRRTHEFALRAAIGAGPFQLAALVAREGAVAVARMVAIGGPAATLVVVCIRPLLFGATAVLTPALVASAIVVMITLLSLSLPALHLRHVDAASVLRATM
jgi:ABC-type antimicrobial peptide transport system permease subunit